MKKLPIDEIRSVLLHCIMEHKSVQQVFDQIYEIIALPMICFDPSFSLIAFSFPRPFYYPHWEWMAEQGSASQENILAYDYLSNQERMIRSPGSKLFDSGTTSGFAQYCGAVMDRDQLLAYCGIMTEGTDRGDVQKTTDLLIKALSVIIRRDRKDEGIDTAILLGKSLTELQADSFRRRCSGNYIFVSATCSANQKSTLQFVKSNLKWKGFQMISSFIGDEMLYMLVGNQNSHMERESFLNALRDLSSKHGILFGLSDYFSGLHDISAYRQQSVLAMSMAAASGESISLSFFIDHYSEYICQCAMEYYGTELCLCQRIRALMEEDERRGTENVRTLKAWFDSSKNNAKAAMSLGIHQATMLNRLKHIASLTGLDPADCFDSLQLELAMFNAINAEALRDMGG